MLPKNAPPPPPQSSATPTLDDLYHMVAHIYSARNEDRSVDATFAHFIEVCGILTLHARDKKREGVSLDDALCKALGWFFPLMARFRVSSVEELIFRKYPLVCPYCLGAPHDTGNCKEVTGQTTVHPALLATYHANARSRPTSLNGWQAMFGKIYPRNLKSAESSVVNLFEELGELAEAVRVFYKHPKYLAGEAADVFSYLMGIANEHALNEKLKNGRVFSFEHEFLQRYPGLCVQCGYRICKCPAIPEGTVGRLAKELDLLKDDPLFTLDLGRAAADGAAVAAKVLLGLGGFTTVAEKLPLDRGETQHALIVLCSKLADALQNEKPRMAADLRKAAEAVDWDVRPPGSREHSSRKEVFALLETVVPLVNPAILGDDGSFEAHLGKLLQSQACRFGIVTALPREFAAVRVMFEESCEYSVEGDPNDYVLGTIPVREGNARHLVVATLLKETGNNSAAATAASLLRSFPKVEDVLMVGIAGGVPSPDDPEGHVRLGDVVVSNKEGVIQYDSLKVEPGGTRVRSSAAKPSARMVGRIQMLEARRLAGERPWEPFLDRGRQLEDGSRPPEVTDTLYRLVNGGEVKCAHPKDPKRIEGLPRIHYGRIGAANTLLKDATIRDRLRAEHAVRAIEMEGSGIADASWSAGQQYLLIRGISDYCDARKLEHARWQGYAAIAAAAYMRALLESVPLETKASEKALG